MVQHETKPLETCSRFAGADLKENGAGSRRSLTAFTNHLLDHLKSSQRFADSPKIAAGFASLRSRSSLRWPTTSEFRRPVQPRSRPIQPSRPHQKNPEPCNPNDVKTIWVHDAHGVPQPLHRSLINAVDSDTLLDSPTSRRVPRIDALT